MSKIKRKKVQIFATYYNFETRYEEEMRQFDDVDVISVNVLSASQSSDSHCEEYLVFYKEEQEADED